jgi:hypothetical protein
MDSSTKVSHVAPAYGSRSRCEPKPGTLGHSRGILTSSLDRGNQ